MTEHSSKTSPTPNTSDLDRSRIQSDAQANSVAQVAQHANNQNSLIEKVFSYLSNGFVLLLIGSLITYYLVPSFQRKYENRKQQVNLMQDCLEEFLLYSNSIWQEYYAILPLTQKTEIDRDEYVKYLNKIAQIKLKRYDAYAKVQAIAIVFRDESSIDTAIKDYALRINTASSVIDKWITNLYCTPTKRDKSPCATFDPTFDSYYEYTKIKDLIVGIGNEGSEKVATLIVKKINEY